MTLRTNLANLVSSLPELKAERDRGPVQNDMYEAIDDWCHLGQRAVAGDTRVNYPARARGELLLLEKLPQNRVGEGDEDREKYASLLNDAEEMIHEIAHIPIPEDGHLGVLRVIREHFAFLFSDHGFTIIDEQPTGMRLSSGTVVLELGWATQSSLSFSSAQSDERCYWIEDKQPGDRTYPIPAQLQLLTSNHGSPSTRIQRPVHSVSYPNRA
jgi:hypothetical protein